MLAAALLIATTPIQPINLDDLSLHRACSLDGQRLFVTFLVGKPPHQEWLDEYRHK
jgi:hypothetical protein